MADMCRQMEELIAETKKEVAINMYAAGYAVEKIAEIAKVSVGQVEAWIAEGK